MKTITSKEWKEWGSFEKLIANRLANGEVLPIRIEKDIYWHFLESVPPEESGKTRHEFINFALPVSSYFLSGEATRFKKGRPVYNCFGKGLEKYWYIGELHKQ